MRDAGTDHGLAAVYRRYNAACNAHRFDQLGEFVAADVAIDGERQGLAAYVCGLEAVLRAFPDYRWDLRHLRADRRGVGRGGQRCATRPGRLPLAG